MLVRPSFVLGAARAIQIVGSDDTLRHYLENAVRIDAKTARARTQYIVGKECEVDAVCDGTGVLRCREIMELIERTGIHSGEIKHERLSFVQPESEGKGNRFGLRL